MKIIVAHPQNNLAPIDSYYVEFQGKEYNVTFEGSGKDRIVFAYDREKVRKVRTNNKKFWNAVAETFDFINYEVV